MTTTIFVRLTHRTDSGRMGAEVWVNPVHVAAVVGFTAFTRLSLNGERIMVNESVDDVLTAFREARQGVYQPAVRSSVGPDGEQV